VLGVLPSVLPHEIICEPNTRRISPCPHILVLSVFRKRATAGAGVLQGCKKAACPYCRAWGPSSVRMKVESKSNAVTWLCSEPRADSMPLGREELIACLFGRGFIRRGNPIGSLAGC
jgi:hypothetical protein